MRPSLKALRSRASERAHRAAEGAAPPAGQDPLPPADMATPGAVERGTIRRRLRRARRMRETLLTELGALVMEMHRQRRHDPALVERKAREALVADREALGLARAIDEEHSVTQVVAAGIAGACHACGSLLGTDDRYCSRCGTAAGAPNGVSGPLGAPTIAAPPPDPGARTEAPPPPGARVGEPVLPPGSGEPVLPPPSPGARIGDPVLPPSPGSRPGAPPPSPGGRVGEPVLPPPSPVFPPPPDPGARVGAPAAPPPDPGRRVHPSTGDPNAPIGPRT